MTGDPADVRGAEEYIFILVVEDILHAYVAVDHVAADGVHDTLRFACGAGGVKNEQRIFRVHLLGRAGVFDVGSSQLVAPVGIPSRLHGNVKIVKPLDHDHTLNLVAFFLAIITGHVGARL